MELSIRPGLQLGVSEDSTTETNTPLQTFPLPRELRDHVLGYLVGHQHVHAYPYYTRLLKARGQRSQANLRDKSRARTYQFHTNIFAVNKQMRKEALEEFHRSNVFVIVSWAWPELGRTLHAFDTPIVTDNQSAVARFKHHTLRLHLQHSTPKKAYGASPQIQSVLMLLTDVPIMCQTLRYISSITPLPCTILLKAVDAPDSDLQTFSNNVHMARPVHSKIQFTESTHSNTAQKQSQLLEYFYHMTIAGQKLTILGALDDNDTSDDKPMQRSVHLLEQLAGPKAIWVKQVAWDKLDTALFLMKAANNLVRKGDLMRAGEHYTRIYSGALPHSILCDLPVPVETSDAAPPIIYALRALHDAAAAAGLLHLRNLNVRGAQEADDCAHGLAASISRYENREAVLGIPGRAVWLQRSPGFHLGLLLQLTMLETGEVNLERMEAAFESLTSAFPSNRHVAHDLRFVRSMRNRQKTSPIDLTPEEVLEQTSAVAMRPQIFSYDVPTHIARPKAFGWIDPDQFLAYFKPDGQQDSVSTAASSADAGTAAVD